MLEPSRVKRHSRKLYLIGLPCLLLACQPASEDIAQQRPTPYGQNASELLTSADAVTQKFGSHAEGAIEYARQRGIELKLNPLPTSAWEVLKATPAIQVGGKPMEAVSIYIVFDANCPHCATLHQRLQRDIFNDKPVRWVPIAFLRPDSAGLAAAILASENPHMSLDVNFRDYDHENKRGGYPVPKGTNFYLEPSHGMLKKLWMQWGGRTPMIIIRTQDGTVFDVRHDKGDGLRWALDLAALPATTLKTYEGTRVKGL